MGLNNIILAISLTITIVIIALMNSTVYVSNNKTETQMQTQKLTTEKPLRVSRFLVQNTKNGRNPNAADHCNKNEEICKSQATYTNSTMECCSNNCVDVGYDKDNCGACKNKCSFTETCCRGECVYLAYDKRHCGECNHRCLFGELCLYGLCNYA